MTILVTKQAMDIKSFLKSANLTRAEFARKVGCHPIKISTTANASRSLAFDTMLRIIEASDGKVTANDIAAPYLRKRAKLPTNHASTPVENIGG